MDTQPIMKRSMHSAGDLKVLKTTESWHMPQKCGNTSVEKVQQEKRSLSMCSSRIFR